MATSPASLQFPDEQGWPPVAIDADLLTIGRGAESDIQLNGTNVSRFHAHIVRTEDGWVLKDLGSSLGTFVNGQRITEHRLVHLDQLGFGQVRADVSFVSASATDRFTQLAIGDLRQISALLEGLRAMGSSRVLSDVLAMVLDSAIEVTGAERGFIMLADAGGRLEFKLARRRDRRTLEGTVFEASRRIPEQVFATGQRQIVRDMLEGDQAAQHPETIALGIRNVLCVPLRLVRLADTDEPASTAESRIGVLYLDSHEKGSLESAVARTALESLANEAAVAIENSRLYREALEKTRLEQQVREVERATQAKSEFLAAMSHEIRSPLNAIIGMGDVLRATALTDEQARCVDVFQRNGEGLLNLINDLLDLSKVESGRVELEAADVDLCDVIARAMEIVEGRTAAQGLYLRRTIAPDVPLWLTGDSNRLRQIITNLLGNAIKFTEAGGIEVRVELDTQSEGKSRLRFAVADTGIGIPPGRMEAIFEGYSQAERSTARLYGGTGLGLTISRRLVELMGGQIWVESEPGAGSTFYFTAAFGVAEGRPAAADLRSAAASVQPSIAGLRILLADDAEDNQFLVLSCLKGSGATVDIAENGRVAVEKFRTQAYDLVLMDVEMPVLDGYAAAREIRELERERVAAPVPILALTALAIHDIEAQHYAHGFTEILTKPIRKVTLREAVARHGSLSVERAGAEDPEMEDVVLRYVEKKRADVAVYRRALADGDLEAIRKLAHKMKGTGSGYGFPALTELGAVLEQAARRGDAAQTGEAIGKFAEYLQTLK